MKGLLLSLCVACYGLNGQDLDSTIQSSGSILKSLRNGDSITYYQCHVETATQELRTASGQTITGKPTRYSITEKFVITKNGKLFYVNYYTSILSDLPNRKFSALKLREKPYWGFGRERSFILDPRGLKVLLAIERKGKEAIEFDFLIDKYNKNQVIIRLGKDFKQLVIEGDYVISKLVFQT